MGYSGQHALMPVAEALTQILASAPAAPETETVYLEQAVARVLAESPTSPVAVPPADNSSMDGYAVSSQDCQNPAMTLPISQRIPAGSAPLPLEPGTAARIFTGAEMPAGADAVVIQENATEADGHVAFSGPINAGSNVRPKGQDIALGAEVIYKGRRLQPADIGLLASTGIDSVRVYRPIKVAIISTGDELVEPGSSLGAGKIYNSNRFVLTILLAKLGCEVVNIGRVQDDLAATTDALERAAEQADCILSTGGVSVGEEDYVKAAVEALGTLQLWRMRIKPGKPLAFGHVKQIPFFGLPGNPASSLITFTLFVRPFLLKMQGAHIEPPLRLSVAAGFERSSAGSREEYMRARYENGVVHIHQNQSSGMLSSASWANGLVVVYPHQMVAMGDLVEFIPFSELLN